MALLMLRNATRGPQPSTMSKIGDGEFHGLRFVGSSLGPKMAGRHPKRLSRPMYPTLFGRMRSQKFQEPKQSSAQWHLSVCIRHLPRGPEATGLTIHRLTFPDWIGHSVSQKKTGKGNRRKNQKAHVEVGIDLKNK